MLSDRVYQRLAHITKHNAKIPIYYKNTYFELQSSFYDINKI